MFKSVKVLKCYAKNFVVQEKNMPITEFLESNARLYPNDVCLVEINPEIKEDRKRSK